MEKFTLIFLSSFNNFFFWVYTQSVNNSYINMNVPNCTNLALFIDWHQIQNETFNLAKTENNVSVYSIWVIR